ncbi:hypothetical protein [Asticcacaulis sp.]|uniref:hypothetical protein n=1 Tax=Asticcacaulis sp. TaxID=1872648 RepID=UPI003F7C0454
MSEDIQSDLAFVKALVSEGARVRISGGALYLTGGLCYGLQCIVQWIHLAGIVNIGGIGNLIAGILPTVVFLAVMGVILWRDRKVPKNGVATRALNAAFSSAGLANLFMVFVFGYAAITEKSILIWLLYPITVCAFQGAVWFTAYMIRREAWLAIISIGWFVTTLALGLLIGTPHYVLVLGLALFVIMGGGGWYMMQQARK